MPLARVRSLPRRLYQRSRTRRASREERGFTPGLKRDSSAPELVISPHFDDAVLDCWSILSSDREVNVVNVFAGAPDGVKVPLWDSITGAEDSSTRVRERTAEDAAALALANRTPVNL